MSLQRDIDWYTRSYPEIEKWLNVCPLCRRRGYKPDMPEHIGGEHSIMVYYVKKYFQPMETDEMGLCMICSRLQQK